MSTEFSTKSFRRAKSVGFTLVELMIAIAVGAVVIATIVMLSIISAQNFVATANYVQMNDQSRLALDLISREIRNATAVTAFSTNSPQFLRLTNANMGVGSTIAYDSTNLTLTVVGPVGQSSSRTLLTGCNSFGFQLFNRYPLTNSLSGISFYASTNAVTGQVDAKFCKVVNMSWKCSRHIVGSKFSTEIVQTAQVVLRNQVSQ